METPDPVSVTAPEYAPAPGAVPDRTAFSRAAAVLEPAGPRVMLGLSIATAAVLVAGLACATAIARVTAAIPYW